MRDGIPHAEAHRMIVSPYHRRQGIAGVLMKTLIAHARKHHVQTLFLHTMPILKAAIKMYEQFGWIEQHGVYVRDGLAGVVLIQFRLDLTDKS
jgi:GNAT superfamily N-acetyltransferase